MKKEKSSNRFHITDLETLRAVSDPLRVQIVELLITQSLTVKQVAKKLGLAPSKLYYHFTTLEKLGLIEVTETRMVANMQEKTFSSTADMLEVDPSLLKFSKEGDNEPINILIASTIDATRDDITRSLQARQFQLELGAANQERRFIINRVISRVSEKRIGEFQERLVKLIQEFDEEDNSSRRSTDQPYALTVAFCPSFYFEKPSKKEKKK